MKTRAVILTSALNAISARIDGRFDDPDLVAYGPLLPSVEDDCRAIASAALKEAATASDLPERALPTERRIAAVEMLISQGFTWRNGQWSKPDGTNIAF